MINPKDFLLSIIIVSTIFVIINIIIFILYFILNVICGVNIKYLLKWVIWVDWNELPFNKKLRLQYWKLFRWNKFKKFKLGLKQGRSHYGAYNYALKN
jgi:hypothetical protein